ncbi:MAG: alpha/beta fold hydrolase [Haloarculaceae archaeon]
MPYATNDGTRLYYEVDGDPDGEAVVLVEGLAYGTWMWDRQRAALADEYRTILPDNRGTGKSDEPTGPYTVEGMAGDLEAVLADAGAERAHVVGASLGGMIAQQYALDYDRARSLVLICTTHGGENAEPIPDETLDRMLNVPEEYGPAERIRYKMRPAFTDEFWAQHPDVVDEVAENRLETDPSDRAYRWQSEAVDGFDVSDRLGELAVPALVVHGTADRVVPVENGRLVAEGLPDAEFVAVEGGPHLVFVERAGEVNDAIRGFLDDV